MDDWFSWGALEGWRRGCVVAVGWEVGSWREERFWGVRLLSFVKEFVVVAKEVAAHHFEDVDAVRDGVEAGDFVVVACGNRELGAFVAE